METELSEKFAFSFSPSPLDTKLMAHEIHVWWALLDQDVSRVESYFQTLSIEERRRAEQFHFDRDRTRFIVRRGMLRRILGSYLNLQPGRLLFRHGRNGKPELAETNVGQNIRFNISHSEGAALFAFARDREIGVDIEYIQDISDLDLIADQFFSSDENDVLQSLTEDEKRRAFFNGWTRKEALVKALGEGLSLPMKRFSVSLLPGEQARLLRMDGDVRDTFRWSIQDLMPTPGYAGAVAARGDTFKPKCWRWEDGEISGPLPDFGFSNKPYSASRNV